MRDLFFAFGFMILTMALGISYLFSFGIKEVIPKEILETYNQTESQIREALSIVQEKNEELNRSRGALESFFNFLGLAFGFIQFIAISLFAIVVSIPKMFFDAISYLGIVLGIEPFVLGIIVSLIVGYLTIKAIQFILNREL